MSEPSFVRPDVPVPDTDADDPRVGHWLGRAIADGAAARVVLLGFPTDEGVRRNGGRPGATGAPAEIRRQLLRLVPDARAGQRMLDVLAHTQDLGDLVVSGDLATDQQLLGQVVGRALAQGQFPIVLGGGHETGYGHFLGYVHAGRPVSIVNWDAHPDVRPLRDQQGHSGSPFRQALLHASKLCRHYTVAGVQPHAAAAAHLAFVKQQRGVVLFRDDVTLARVRSLHRRARTATMVTFDIDAVDQAQAPGVSAPAMGGLDARTWLTAAFEAGRAPTVTSCDIVEMNPVFDRDGQTARLAGLTVWHILRGLASRPAARTRRAKPNRKTRSKPRT